MVTPVRTWDAPLLLIPGRGIVRCQRYTPRGYSASAGDPLCREEGGGAAICRARQVEVLATIRFDGAVPMFYGVDT